MTSFQLNVDGQQVTNVLTGGGDFGQPRYSRDAIAEFEFVANRFDATQGRSMGVQVNAVTKSGTNTRAGTFAGYFRNDKFNAADFIQHRVIPYSDQQLSMTYGGPILKDRIWFFENSGRADYNALQLQANRRFAGGLQFGVAYTLSRARDYTSNNETGTGSNMQIATYQNPDAWNYGLSTFDQTHIAVINYTWDLPNLGARWHNGAEAISAIRIFERRSKR